MKNCGLRPANEFAADKSTKSASADYIRSARRGTSCYVQTRFQPPVEPPIESAGRSCNFGLMSRCNRELRFRGRFQRHRELLVVQSGVEAIQAQ